MQVNRPFADTGMFSDIVDGDPAIAPALEELSGGIEDTLGAKESFIEFRRRIRDQSNYFSNLTRFLNWSNIEKLKEFQPRADQESVFNQVNYSFD